MNAKAEEVDLKAAVEDGLKESEAPVENEIEVTWTPEEAAEAEAMGWIPPERAGKLPEGKKFTPPKEFMERNPLYGKLKKLESSIGHLNDHYKKVADKEVKNAQKEFEAKLAKLEAEKIEALDNADHARVVEIDKELRDTEKPVENSGVDGQKLVNDWISDGNKWYKEDSFLHDEFDIIAENFHKNRGFYGKELLNKTKEHLKQKYPDKFSNPNREKPSAVEGGTAKPAKKGSVSLKDLTADEMKIFKNFNMDTILKTDAEVQKYVKETIALRD